MREPYLFLRGNHIIFARKQYFFFLDVQTRCLKFPNLNKELPSPFLKARTYPMSKCLFLLLVYAHNQTCFEENWSSYSLPFTKNSTTVLRDLLVFTHSVNSKIHRFSPFPCPRNKVVVQRAEWDPGVRMKKYKQSPNKSPVWSVRTT